jgi:hypothetical protein
MFTLFIKYCNFIYEKISDRFNNLIVDHRSLLEENSYYCRMTDGNFSLKTNKDITQNNIQERIKERMKTYRK